VKDNSIQLSLSRQFLAAADRECSSVGHDGGAWFCDNVKLDINDIDSGWVAASGAHRSIARVLCATLVDFASGDGAHGDFVRDLVSDVVDCAGRGCRYFWTGRLGVAPDERTEAAKACAAAAVHRHRVTVSRPSTSHHHHHIPGSVLLCVGAFTAPLISYDHCKCSLSIQPSRQRMHANQSDPFTCLLFPPYDYK
jgi:hypothetical protein